MEARPEDVSFADGKYSVAGTDKSVGFGDVALTAYVPHNYPADLEPGMDFSSFYDPANFTYPFGAHIAVVEVDRATGKVDLVDFVAVDDVGNFAKANFGSAGDADRNLGKVVSGIGLPLRSYNKGSAFTVDRASRHINGRASYGIGQVLKTQIAGGLLDMKVPQTRDGYLPKQDEIPPVLAAAE